MDKYAKGTSQLGDSLYPLWITWTYSTKFHIFALPACKGTKKISHIQIYVRLFHLFLHFAMSKQSFGPYWPFLTYPKIRISFLRVQRFFVCAHLAFWWWMPTRQVKGLFGWVMLNVFINESAELTLISIQCSNQSSVFFGFLLLELIPKFRISLPRLVCRLRIILYKPGASSR